jgi:hypothetical protein
MRYMPLAAALAAALTISPASATIRIAGDSGGVIGTYLDRGESMRRSGDRVVIDGPCLSACTLVLGSVPRDRICVTSRAQLGFHAAYDPGPNGEQVTNRAGTSLLMGHYPSHIRSWIARHGGLTPRMIYLSGSELSSMYASCDSPAFADRPGAAGSRAAGGSASGRASNADAWRQDAAQPTAGTAHRPQRRTQHRNP